MKKYTLFSIIIFVLASFTLLAEDYNETEEATLFPEISQLKNDPDGFVGKMVSVHGKFVGWKFWDGPPPVSRSDWSLKSENGELIYCTGSLPKNFRPDDPACLGKQVNILGRVQIDGTGRPYLSVSNALPTLMKPEKMVSVSQIIFDPLGMSGQKLGLLGVLTKGYSIKGRRYYFLADPTGVIRLEKLPKLLPKGSILRVRGTLGTDNDGLPVIKNVEIVFAQP